MQKRLLILVGVLMCVCATAQAERRVILGARGGLLSRSVTLEQDALTFTNSNGDVASAYENFSLSSRYGFNAAFVFRALVWQSKNVTDGASLFVECDAEYAQNNIHIDARREGDVDDFVNSKIIMRTVDVPVLLCLKASVVRLSAGPVLHAYKMYDSQSGNVDFNGVNPLCGYTLGIGFDFGKVTLDGRYCGEFAKHSWDVMRPQSSAHLTGAVASWSIGLGVAF